ARGADKLRRPTTDRCNSGGLGKSNMADRVPTGSRFLSLPSETRAVRLDKPTAARGKRMKRLRLYAFEGIALPLSPPKRRRGCHAKRIHEPLERRLLLARFP